MSVIVKRGLGDRPGEDIVSPILTTEELQKFRGTQEIDANDSDRVMLSGEVVGTVFLAPGDIIAIEDGEGTRNGYLERTAISISMDPYSVTTSVEIEQIKD